MSGERAKRIFFYCVVFVSAITVFVSLPDTAFGAVRTWDGGGGDNNWSTCANWDGPDTCPTSSDTATFNATSTKDSTIDAGFAGTVTAIDIQSGYTGIIAQARTLTVNGPITQADGTFTGATQSILAQSLTLTGGTFTSTSGTFSITRNFTKSGSSTFNANSGTVTFLDFSGSDDTTITCTTSVTFNRVVFTKDDAGAVVVGSGCTIPLGASPSSSFNADNLTNNGTITVDSGTWTVNGSVGGNPNVTFTNNGTITHNGSGWIIVGNFINGSSGVVTYSGSTLSVYVSLDVSQGTFPSGLTVSFLDSDGNDDATLTCGSVTFTQVIMTKDDAGDLTISSGCTVPLGASPTSRFNASSLVNNGTITVSSGTWTINGSGGGNSNMTFTNNGTVTHNGSGWVIVGNFTNGSSGIVTYAGSTLTVYVSLNVSQGTFPSGLTVTFADSDGNDDATLTCGSVTFTQVVITKDDAGDLTISSGCTVPLGASPTSSFNAANLINNGTITVSSGTWTINGSIAANGNITFTNNGTITHSGSGWVIGGNFVNGSSGLVTYSGSTLTLRNNLDTSQGTFPSGLSVTFTDADSNDSSTLTCGSATLGDATINKTTTATLTLGSSCTITGNFTRTDGAVSNPSSAYTLFVAGNMSISTTDTFGGANMTVEFNGSADRTITQNAGTFSAKYKVNKSVGNKVTQTTNLVLGNTFTVTSGTHDQGATFNLTTGGATTIESNGTWLNTGTGDITLAGDVTVSGTATIDGSGAGCGGADAITIASSSGGTQRTWSGSGTFSPMYDVSVSDQTGSVTVISGTNTSNNGWTFIASCNADPNAPGSLGPAGYVDGSWTTDNTPTFTFSLSDPDGADTVKYQIQIDDTAGFGSVVVDYTSALAAQGSFSFTVGQAAGSGSYATGSAGQTLSDSSGYYWRVKTIDNSAAESSYSTANSGSIAFKVDTTAPTAGSLSLNTRTTSSITVQVAGASDAMSGLAVSPYNFANNTASTISGAQAGTTWLSNSLTPNTEYTFQVTVTDLAGNSANSATFDAFTLANPPSNLILTADGTTQITASWQVNSNPAGTEFFAENTTNSTSSGWIADAVSWISSGLSAETNYTFSVKARNGDGVETAIVTDTLATPAAPPSSSGSARGVRQQKSAPEFKWPKFDIPFFGGNDNQEKPVSPPKPIKVEEPVVVPPVEPVSPEDLITPEAPIAPEPDPIVEEEPKNIIEEVVAIIEEITESVVEVLQEIIETVVEVAAAIPETVALVAQSIRDAVSGATESFANFITSTIPSYAERSVRFISSAGSRPLIENIRGVVSGVREVTSEPVVQTAAAVSIIAPATASAAVVLAPAVAAGVPLANQFSYLMIFTAQLLGLRKKPKPWGTVYDSLTKQPIPFARVEVLSKLGRRLDSTVTDQFGRYGFLLANSMAVSGGIALRAFQEKYVFPGEIHYSEIEELIYPNVYRGGVVEVKSMTNYDIPLEPKAKPPRRFYPTLLSKNINNLLVPAMNVLFTVGAIFAILFFSVNPGIVAGVLLVLVTLTGLLKKSGFGLKPFGLTEDIIRGHTMPFSFIALHDETGARVNFTVSDDQGRYFILVPGGTYQIKAHTPAHIEPPRDKVIRIRAKGGWVSKEIKL